MQVDKLCTCISVVIDVYSLWNYWNLKNRVLNFSGTERVNLIMDRKLKL